MGFEVGEYERVVEMPLDVAMRWVAEDSDAGGPATGYAEDTRLQLRLEVDGFEYAELDPERCDDTSCTLEDGGMIDGTGCEPFLLVRASGELETEDGAVQATLESQNVRLMRPHEETDLTVAARADLAAVRGTLRIDPAVPEPYGGVIDLSVHYELSGELRYAVVAVGVYPDWEHRNENAPEIPSELSSYRPLQGRAGSPPSDRPLVGGPGSSP